LFSAKLASLPAEGSLASPDAFLGNGSSQRSANIGSSDGSSLTVNLNQKVSAVFVFDDE